MSENERFFLECEGMLCWVTDSTKRDDGYDGHLSNQETVDLLNEQDRLLKNREKLNKILEGFLLSEGYTFEDIKKFLHERKV